MRLTFFIAPHYGFAPSCRRSRAISWQSAVIGRDLTALLVHLPSPETMQLKTVIACSVLRARIHPQSPVSSHSVSLNPSLPRSISIPPFLFISMTRSPTAHPSYLPSPSIHLFLHAVSLSFFLPFLSLSLSLRSPSPTYRLFLFLHLISPLSLSLSPLSFLSPLSVCLSVPLSSLFLLSFSV